MACDVGCAVWTTCIASLGKSHEQAPPKKYNGNHHRQDKDVGHFAGGGARGRDKTDQIVKVNDDQLMLCYIQDRLGYLC